MTAIWTPTDRLRRLRELERVVSAPLDPEQEAWRMARRSFVLHRGQVHRLPRVAGASISTAAPPVEVIYSNQTAGTAKNTFTTEAQVNDAAGMGSVAQLNSTALWGPGASQPKAALNVLMRGILSSTSTPTYQWFFRFGTSSAGALLAGTAALTTLTTITNQIWEGEFTIQPVTLAAAGANSTFRGLGMLSSPGGLAAPGVYNLWAGAASPGTVATVDWSVVNAIWVALACSASSSSNGVTLLQLFILGA